MCDTELSHDTNLYSTGITVSLQSVAPVGEPGNDGNITVDVCVTVESTPGPIDRVGDIVITFNTVLGTAGTLLSYRKCIMATFYDLLHIAVYCSIHI